MFGKIGAAVAAKPKISIGVSLFMVFVFASGFSKQVNETRPEKQWVPEGSDALFHKDYVDDSWPGQQRFNVWIATCKDVKQSDCNILESKYLKSLAAIQTKITEVVVDGDALFKDEAFKGKWSFSGSVTGSKSKCFKYGPSCAQSSVLEVFDYDKSIVDNKNDAAVLQSINDFEAKQVGPAPIKMEKLMSSGSGVTIRDATTNKVSSAWSLMGYYVLSKTSVMTGRGPKDLVADEWEKKALCVMGIDTTKQGASSDECPADKLLTFSAQFQRSLGDEFGASIKGDIAFLGSSYMAILAYLVLMLSRFDHVNSMIAMSTCVVLIVGLSYAAAMGFGFYCGIPNNQLTLNIPFLLLGLGVDDAFVLASEFDMNRLRFPADSMEKSITRTAMTGGVSVLITSVTDALAFLVGSATVLPALSGFCVFAGLGVIFCFILQLSLFLPVLLINAKRANAGYLDCLCCFKSSSAATADESGGKGLGAGARSHGKCVCCPCKPAVSPDQLNKEIEAINNATGTERELLIAQKTHGTLGALMRKWGEFITSKAGLAVTFIVFAVLLAMGVLGATKIYKDFKIEWFVPAGSYLEEFFTLNEDNFASGTPFTVYVHSGLGATESAPLDLFASRADMDYTHTYLTESTLVDQSAGITDWYHTFKQSPGFDESSSAAFFTTLWAWAAPTAAGSRFASNLHWRDAKCVCTGATCDAACDPTKGVTEMRFQATLSLDSTRSGNGRFDTMTAVRKAFKEKFDGMAFPYSFQFLYWEEVGIIDSELTRNLIICGAVICVIIGILIPNPRVAVFVIGSILLALVELVGFMHWWGVTVSGVSTIYILISVGLAVDYSAHIAHVFAHSAGTPKQRAIGALARIGPCVFNAVFSTFLAVVVISSSKSFIFKTFFKALCLVCLIGGAHGLWLLPALLSLFGGSKDEDDSAEHNKPAVVADDVADTEPAVVATGSNITV